MGVDFSHRQQLDPRDRLLEEYSLQASWALGVIGHAARTLRVAYTPD